MTSEVWDWLVRQNLGHLSDSWEPHKLILWDSDLSISVGEKSTATRKNIYLRGAFDCQFFHPIIDRILVPVVPMDLEFQLTVLLY